MIAPSDFYNHLITRDISFFTGVPDSLLKDFCFYINDKGQDIICANEGASIALASGYHLATRKIPLVYMQNSGFGNAINPLTSLADPSVYGIPMLIMVGWRGAPNVKDEPQHNKMGSCNISLIESLGIPFTILSNKISDALKQLDTAIEHAHEFSAPYIFLVQKDTFLDYQKEKETQTTLQMTRESAIEIIVEQLQDKDLIISTTGKASRELYEIRNRRNEGIKDFFTVGSMGHASMIALGVALQTSKNVICLDGDGALLMHMGSLSTIANQAPKNYKHILLNNGCHDSVGGQNTVGFTTDFKSVIKGVGYKSYNQAKDKEELLHILPNFLQSEGPSFLEVLIKKGARTDLGRPSTTPQENKAFFISHLNEGRK